MSGNSRSSRITVKSNSNSNGTPKKKKEAGVTETEAKIIGVAEIAGVARYDTKGG